MVTINERILQIIDIQCEGKRNKFAEMIEFSPQVVYNIVSGRKSKPSFDVIHAIVSTFVDINPRWLITGEGDMYIEESEMNNILAEESPTYDSGYIIELQRRQIELLENEIYLLKKEDSKKGDYRSINS